MQHIKSITRITIILLGLIVLIFTQASKVVAMEGMVTPMAAKKVAVAWMTTIPDFSNSDGLLLFTPSQEVLEIKDQNQIRTIAYILELDPKGFIVVSPSYDLNPIIAFSNNSYFDKTESPENILLDLIRSDISERLALVEAKKVLPEYTSEANKLWQGYMEFSEIFNDLNEFNDMSASSWDVSHGPFLTSLWGQSTDGAGRPTFNYYTPPGPDGLIGNYVSGCVATALGQILNYYEWPLTGTGIHSYLWNNGQDPPKTLSVNFGNTTYNWVNVLDNYTGSGTTLTQRRAAGLITYHAGVAVNMNYTSSGSGAGLSIVENVLENHFRFSGEYVANNGDFYNRLYNSMLAQRPSELGISGNLGGHAVVVDGVRHNNSGNTTRYYHLNMGWNGYSDAWYDIASNFTAGSGTWNTVHGAVLDIVPNPDMVDPGVTTLDGTFPVSWTISPNQGTCHYELQQLLIPESTVDFIDGAENGTGNWDINGHWEISNNYHYNGVSAYRGHVYNNSSWNYPGTMTFSGSMKINPSTSLSYSWGTYFGQNLELRIEISLDGVSWETLESHTDSSTSLNWHQENVTTTELLNYVGDQVKLRFVIDYLGGSVYTMSNVGFYIDDFSINDVSLGSWETLASDISSTSRMVNVNQEGDYSYRVRAHCSKWYDWSDVESIYVSGNINNIYIPMILK